MMKVFIALMLLVASNAYAEHREMYALNGDGGILTLTNEPCDMEVPPGTKVWVVTSETATGDVIHGCWTFATDADAVIVYWENGFASALTNPSAFSMTKPQRDNESKMLNEGI